jgi:signal transduction histidine kinase
MVGALWGATPFLLPPDPPIHAVMTVMMFLPGAAAAGAMTAAADLRVVTAYIIPALSFCAAWLLIQDLTATGPLLAFCAGVFAFILFNLARTYSHQLVEAVEANVQLDRARRETDAQSAALTRLAARQEEAAKAAETQARANAAMLSNMSHELSGPLNAVMGMSQMLREADLPSDQARMAARIRESGEHLSEMLGSILDISAIQAGRMELVLDDISAMNLAERLESRYTPQARAKGLDFEVDLEGDLNLVLRADMRRVLQIASIFTSNAIRFTETGGVKVVISAKRGEDGAARLRLEVRDTGIGVPEASRGHLFEAFAEETPDMAIREAGTGLDLHLSKALARLMEGEVGYEDLDPGSMFHFEAPFRVSSKEDKYAGERLAVTNRRLRILVAEGDGARRSVLLGYLKSFNCVVACVDSRTDMLTALNASAYDALVMGLTLTDLDPEDAVADVRALPSTPTKTPKVRLAADLDAPMRRAGSDALVRAPVAADPLLQGLQAALGHDPAAAAQLRMTA